jgi:hypothetical protein
MGSEISGTHSCEYGDDSLWDTVPRTLAELAEISEVVTASIIQQAPFNVGQLYMAQFPRRLSSSNGLYSH